MGNVISFLAITGHPTKDELEVKIKSFKEVGITEILAYPRSGCLVPYLSEEWFTVVNNIISICEENGMYLWLYDEFNWPSGGAGGKVQNASVKNWSKKIILQNDEPVIVSEKKFPDLLSENAVSTFINLTHEQYYERFKKYFGNVIKGVFTDEPCFSYNTEWDDNIVYYDNLEKDYYAVCNRDFFEDTISYYNHNAPKGYAKILYDLYAKRFAEGYLKRLADWCEEHGVVLTGHLLADTSVQAGTHDSGDTILGLKQFHIPGIDDINTRIGGDILVAYAHIDAVVRATKKDAMIELFALGPCDMSYDVKLRSLYLASAFGINRYFLAVAHLDAKGNYHKLRNYFNTECSVSPDFKKLSLLSKEAVKAEEYAKKESEIDVYVRYPRNALLKIMDNGRETSRQINKKIEILLYDLYSSQVSFGFLEDGLDAENVLCVDENGVYEEKSGEYILDVKSWCDQNIIRKIVVREKDKIAEKVFVKAYKDGNILIINCGEDRDVDIFACGKVISKHLRANEVLFKEDLITEPETISVNPDFKVFFEHGVYRPFLWEEASFVAKEDVTARFLIRSYPEISPILLDENEIKATSDCDKIGEGFNTLYKMSEPITIKKGVHKIKNGGNLPERLYLPLCIVIGDFESTENELYKKTTSGNSAHFFKDCTFSCALEIPENAESISFDSSNLLTKVYIQKEEIGMNAKNHIVLSVPEKFKGKKVNIDFVQTSNIAPIFGNVETDYNHKMNETPDWNKTFGVMQKPHGISNVKFITE